MKLKIAQITPYYYPSIGGVAGVAQYVSEELVKLGHKVDVITAKRDHKGRPKLNAPKFEIINGVNVYRYKSILNVGHMSFFPALINHLIRNKYDIVHFHSYRHPLCDISALLGKLKSSVTILHGHGPFFEDGEIKAIKQKFYSFYDKIETKTLFKLTDRIIALNNYEKTRYEEMGIPEEQIIVIANAADNSCFVDVDNTEFIKKLNLSDKQILLFVGILNGFKRPDLLIKALPKVIKSIDNAHLILVGPDGGMLKEVIDLGKQLNVENYFTYIGPLYGLDKQMAYQSAKVFILPSDWESFGMVAVEALAHGLPVVTTDSRGPVDIIENGKTGFVVPKRDVKQIADSIIKLLGDEKLYKTMSQNARETALKKYKADSITREIENIYFELLRN